MSTQTTVRPRSIATTPFLVAALFLFSAPAHAQKLDVQYVGTRISGGNGFSVSSGFDCDGDGIADVAVGAPFESIYQYGDGTVRVYSGATHALLRQITLGGYIAQEGWSVALVGDVDGDGYGDVVVGAPWYNNGDGYVAAYSVKNDSLLWIIYGAAQEQMGWSVAAAGDVDHDGHMDVLVGAPGGNNVYLFGWGTGALHQWHGSQAGSFFGASVAGNVDVDGDGTMDVIVGTPYYDVTFPFPKTDVGRIDVYSGSTHLGIWGANGDQALDTFGASVCGIGDVNGDGRSEVVAGAPGSNANGSHAGLVRRFDGTGAVLDTIHGPAVESWFGSSLAAVPDVDGDGTPDYAVGTGVHTTVGFAELHRGSDDALLWTYVPPDNSYQFFGCSVAGGDVNGDGTGDVIIGDSGRDVSGIVDAGDADVLLGGNATATSYGTGYPGTLGIPNLTGLADPGIGATFVAGVTNSRGANTIGVVLVGFARLNVVTAAGGTLLVAPFLTFSMALPATGAVLSGPIPDDTSLIGAIVDLQVLELDPGATHKLSFTPGLELKIGVDYP